VEETKKQAIDLIVMSTHGRSAVAHVLRGSVTEYVIRNAPCPVVAIGPETVRSRAKSSPLLDASVATAGLTR